MSTTISGIATWLKNWFFTEEYDTDYDFVMDTGWVDVTYSALTGYSSFRNYNSGTVLRVRRIGNIVHLDGTISTDDVDIVNIDEYTTIGYLNWDNLLSKQGETQFVTVAELDDMFCPSQNVHQFEQGSMHEKFIAYVTPAGKLRIGRYGWSSSNNDLPVPPWLNVMMSWTVG